MIDVRKCLKGTKYDKRADYIASKIENAGLNRDETSIENIAQIGLAGLDVNDLIRTILEQHRKPPKKKSTRRRTKKKKEATPEVQETVDTAVEV